jgi:hypothetical protein
MSFAALKKNKTGALAALQQKVQASAAGEGGGGNKDPRKFKLTYDKTSKIGSAVIRFLPFGGGDRLPWAEWIEFSFKGKGGNFWNRSLKAIGQDDPVAELNHLQWERNQGADQDEVRKRGRRLRYISNIVVVSDPAHPENNGKVFLFEYGPAIHKKIIAAMVPEYEDQSPIPVFDMWEGATFRLRTKDKSGFLNYDDSTFDPASLLHKDDAVLEKFFDGMHDITEFEAESNYKSYADLDKDMRKVLGGAYVAAILGESFNPAAGAQQAAGGGNPFPQKTEEQQQADTTVDDPFAGAQQAAHTPAEEGADPFAGVADQGAAATSDDPFADLGM